MKFCIRKLYIHKLQERNFHNKRGQSLMEVILAMAIFSMISAVMATLAVGGFTALMQGGEQTEAEALAQEGIEAVKSIRDGAWNEVNYNQSGVELSGGQWIFSGEGSSETIGQYTRTITFDAVCRDGSNNIVTCPGSYTDVQTKRATITVSWTIRSGITNSAQRVAYISNWDSREWAQTNWSGGTGQTQWSDATKYSSGTNVNHTVTGQLQLAAAADGTWTLSGGTTVTDTSDTDFNQGTYSSTQVTGSGSAGSVILTQSALWSLHTDTGNETWNDIVCTSASNCWAVGDSGALAQYNGTSWTESTIASSADINSVYALSSSDIWAAGATGRLWHYNGTSWSLHTDTGGETWNDIVCTSASNCWSVGNSGTLAQYNGTSWTESTIVSSANINTAYALSSSDIWVAGASGRLWHYDGTSWSLHTDTGGEVWNDVYLVNANDGWVVGNSGVIRRWLGTSWNSFLSPTTRNLNAVFMASLQAGWSVGNNGTILRFSRIALYETSGSATSSAFNMSNVSPVQAIDWDETIPSCSPACDITIDVSTAPDSGGSPGVWTGWQNAAAPSGTLLPTSLNGNQWARYRANLTGDGSDTPVLTEARINYK